MLIGDITPKSSMIDLAVTEKLIGATDVDFTALEQRITKIENKQNIILILVGILVFLQLKDILK